MALPMTPDTGMQPPDTMQPADPAGGPGAPDEADGTVCVTPQPDGTFLVGLDGGDMQPAADMKTALTMVRSLLMGEQPQDSSSMQDAFKGGFAGGTPPMGATPMAGA